jgi:hypothetical protein
MPIEGPAGGLTSDELGELSLPTIRTKCVLAVLIGSSWTVT